MQLTTGDELERSELWRNGIGNACYCTHLSVHQIHTFQVNLSTAFSILVLSDPVQFLNNMLDLIHKRGVLVRYIGFLEFNIQSVQLFLHFGIPISGLFQFRFQFWGHLFGCF